MATLTPTLPEIIDKLEKRVTSLEISGTLPKNLVGPTLTIANLTTQISQYVEATTGQMRGRVLLDWDDIVSPSADLLTVDPFDHYEIAYLLPTETAQTQVSSDQSAAVFNNLPLDVNITFKVRAVTVSNVKGPWTGTTINTSHDTTPPVQPSTPTVTAALKSVIVSWDGKDSTNAAMASDFAYCEVHVSKTGATFTPSTTTYVNRLYKGGGIINVLSDDTYATLYVRLVAYDTSGNASVVSTAGSATPIKAVSTDLGIALPGDIAYRDEGNLVVDGSFESEYIRAARENIGHANAFAFESTAGMAAFGSWCISVVGDAQTDKYWSIVGGSTIIPEVPVVAGTKLYVAARIRGISANGTARIIIRFLSQTNVYSYVTFVTATSTGSYVLIEGIANIPTDAKTIAVYCNSLNHTTGTWYFDAVQVRAVVGTMLIEDAAITTAKIANLAVNDAKIADLSAAKITTGQLQASTEIIAGSTSTAHARLTGSGLRVFGPDTTGDGVPDEVIRLGTTSDDYFGIVNGAGTLISSIDNTGKGTFTGLSVTGDPTIQGELLSAKLNKYSTGIVEWRYNGTTTTQPCTTAVGLGQLSAYTVPGRRYRIKVFGLRSTADAAATQIQFELRYLWGTGTISLTNYTGYLGYVIHEISASTEYHSVMPIEQVFTGNGYMRILLVAYRVSGSGNCTAYWSNTSPLNIVLEDLGVINNSAWEPNNGGGSGAPTTMQYTSIWQSASSASYKGDNTQRSTSNVYQYYYPGTSWGDQKGAWYFPNNAISGETDKTMAAALAGAVSIDGVWIYANAEHWYWNDGGIAKIYAHGSTSNSGSRPATWDYLASSGGGAEGRWPKPGARWVYVGNSANWKNLYRGFGIGPAGVADNTYYGYFTGGTGAQIQVRYTR